MKDKSPVCLVCEQTQAQVPLIQLLYLEKTYHICPEHFPILIHDPQKLAGRLPGAEKLHGRTH